MPKTIHEYEQEILKLEHEIRYLVEKVVEEKDDAEYWRDKYFELYEQEQL
jgi:hypothetical protein